MKSMLALSSLLSLSMAAIVPKALMRRGDLCSQYATTMEGDFTLYNNAWGKDQATDGSQCTGVDSANGNSISWHSTWTWQGGQGSVKSFPNAGYQFNAKTLNSVKSIPSKWEWRYGIHLQIDWKTSD